LLPLLVACAPPMWGTWLFTKEVTLPTGQECTHDLIHNLVGAYEPIAPGDDPTWTETDTGSQSADKGIAPRVISSNAKKSSSATPSEISAANVRTSGRICTGKTSFLMKL